ncbi:MAG: Rho termination factor N-terminal domain-containing protein [Anaerolineales bacterium]|nr:Rho termination factor N-terminal domain-containing protein [Anaerolineales bacterium]
MTIRKLADPLFVQVLAARLGIDEPYNVRIAGNRIEFHLRTRVLVHQFEQLPEHAINTDTKESNLSQSSRADLLQLAANLDIPRRSSMTKTQLLQAINEVQAK